MKKIGLFFALTFISSFVFSQHIRIGIDPGLALSRGSYQPEAGLDRRIYAGFDGGVLVEFGITSRVMIQPEVNYSMVGVELNSGSSETTKKLRYITIPVLLKVNMAKCFGLFAGPQLGILTAAIDDPSGASDGTTDIKESFKSTDVDLVFGGELKCGHHTFLSARYSLGLSQIAEEGAGFEMKNRSVSFRIGYIF